MSDKAFITVASTLFVIVGAAHLVRALTGVTLVLGGFEAPLWSSWLVGLVLALLAISGFRRLGR